MNCRAGAGEEGDSAEEGETFCEDKCIGECACGCGG
jgi:hypothetical protein